MKTWKQIILPLLTLTLLLTLAWVSAVNPPELSWNMTAGGSDEEGARTVVVDGSNNVFVSGSTDSFDVGGGDFWILKYDVNGTLLWNRSVGGIYHDENMGAALAANNNIIATGYTKSFASGPPGDYDVWTMKYDSDGNQIWNRTLGWSGWDFGFAAKVDSSNNVIVAGYTSSFSGGGDYLIIKYDENGTLLWNNTVGGDGTRDYAWAVAVDSADNIIVTGDTKSYGASPGSTLDVWTLKYDADGNLLWNTTAGGADNEVGLDICVDSSDNIYVVGRTESFGEGDRDFWTLKYNSSGSLIWNKTAGGADLDIASGVVIDSTGNVIVSGQTNSTGNGGMDAWILWYNLSGSLLMNTTVGGDSDDTSTSVAVDSNNNILSVGDTESYGAGNADFWILKYAVSTTTTTSTTTLLTTTTSTLPVGTIYLEHFNASSNWTWAGSNIYLNTLTSSAKYYITSSFKKAYTDFTYTSISGTVYEIENNFTLHYDPDTTQGVMFGFVDDISQGEGVSWIESDMVGMRVNNYWVSPTDRAVAYFIVRKNGTTLYTSPYPDIYGYGEYRFRLHILNETHFNVTIWFNGNVINSTLVNKSATGITTNKVAIYNVDVNSNIMAGSYEGYVDYFKIEGQGGVTTTTVPATTSTTTTTSTTIPQTTSTSTTTSTTTTSTTTTTLISGVEVYVSTYNTLVNDNVIIYALVRNGTNLGGGSSLTVTVDETPLTLWDSGNYALNGDLYAGDRIYSNWYTPAQDKTYTVTLTYGSENNSTQFKTVSSPNVPYLLVITDYKRLYNEFMETGANNTQDLDSDAIPDYYNLVEKLKTYAQSYSRGMVYDLGKEITTANGYSADYASLNYSIQEQRLAMGQVIDTFIENISDKTKVVRRQLSLCYTESYCTYRDVQDHLDYIAIIGDDEVVPFYRRTDPTEREKGRTSAGTCTGREGYVDYDMDCIERIGEADARGNPSLNDTDEGGYIMTDLPYATRADDDPDGKDCVEPDIGVGRVFANDPNHLVQMIVNYETQITVNEAVLLVNDDSIFIDEATNILAPTLRNYLSAANVDTVLRWLPNGAISHINSTPLTYLLSHANHLSWSDSDSFSDLDVRQFDAMGWVGARLLFSDGCHSGYTLSNHSTANMSTRDYDSVYNNSLARIIMHQGITFIAPTTYGLGNNDSVPEVHELVLDKLSQNIFTENNVGDLWMNSLKDYIQHRGCWWYWNDEDTYTLYSVGLYGLPTQALRGVKSVGNPAPPFRTSNLRSHIASDASAAGPSYSRDNARIWVRETGNNTMVVSIDVPAVYNETIEGSTILKIPGGTTTYEAGGPVLPMLVVSRLLPKGSNVTSVNLTLANVSQILTNVNLLNTTIYARRTGVSSNIIANISEPYPENISNFNLTEREDGILLYINIVPLQYNISTGSVVVYNHLEFTVNYVTPNKTVGDPELSSVSVNDTSMLSGAIISVNVTISSPSAQNASLSYQVIDETSAVLTSNTYSLNLSNGSNTVSFTVNTSGFNPGDKSLSLTLSHPDVGVIETNTTEFSINGIFIDVSLPSTELDPMDTEIIFNITVRDENGTYVSGLSSADFTATLDGNSTELTQVTEVVTGIYQIRYNVTGFTIGQYSLLVYIVDSRGVAEYNQVIISKTSQTKVTALTTGWNLISLSLNIE